MEGGQTEDLLRPRLEWLHDADRRYGDTCIYAHIHGGTHTPSIAFPMVDLADFLEPHQIIFKRYLEERGCKRGDDCILYHGDAE